MRRAAKVDDNQAELVEAYRRLGCSVAPTHQIGHGFPDLIVAVLGCTDLVEVKDGSKVPSKRRLNPDQKLFWSTWKGQLRLVENQRDVLAHVNQMRARAYREREAPVVPVGQTRGQSARGSAPNGY